MNMIHFQLHDFHGGIHPDENKLQSTQQEIRKADIPKELILPIAQHIGKKAKPIVNVGDSVLKGQVIAEADGFVSANLHAPTSGTIKAIEERVIAHPSGMGDLCIIIETDGKDTWIEHKGLDNPLETDRDTLIDIIEQSGITGLGGASFPTHVKTCVPEERIDTLILNAAECEPYITADDMLMRTYADGLVKGIELLFHIYQPESCLIGIEDNKPEAIEALQKALDATTDDTHNIHVVTIPTKYPSGGEKQLIQILTGKEVPANGLPADIGVACQNVGTAYAIYEAIYLGKPLIKRITTVTGEAANNKANFETLLGTPVHHLLEQGETDFDKVHRLIMGGPMMGFTLQTDEVPVVKSTNCIIASTANELPDPAMEQPCIRCGMCTEACPAQLLPQQLYWFSKSSNLEQAEQHNIADCIECGACAYVCPSNIPLVQYYRHTKGEIKQAQADKIKSDRAKERFEARLARQEREKAEKEAKRKARAEAAAKKQAEKAAAAPKGDSPAASTNDTAAELEKLQKKLEASKTAIAKSKEKLEEAKAEGSDKVEAFEKALTKSQDKMKDLAKQIAELKKAQKSQGAASSTGADKGDPNSPERLKQKLETAKVRLATAEKRLAEAQADAEQADKVDALKIALDKQKERVLEAEANYESGLEKQPASTQIKDTAPAADRDALEKKVLAAQTRVDKAQERLNMAIEQNLDTVDALRTGLEKQQAKLEEARKALEETPA